MNMAAKKLIFLIDDDKICNLINRRLIISTGFANDVVAFYNAKDALTSLRSLKDKTGFPDVIFLDINMTVMNGWEFLAEFEQVSTEQREDCKIFMLSSSVYIEDIKRSSTYAVVSDYISKPINEKALSKLMLKEN